MIIFYTGRQGTGKTITMLKDALKFKINGWKVYSNMENSKIGSYISNEDILNLDKKSSLENAVLLVDEAQILFESSQFMSKENKKFSHFVQQLRKRNIHLLYTSQFTKRVDVRLRENTDILVEPRYNKKFDVVKVTYTDLTSVNVEDTETPMISKVLVYNPLPLFDLFNTRERIA